MKNMNSQPIHDNVMVQNQNVNVALESNTKGSLQDGGPQQNMNSDRANNDSLTNMEGHNSDMNNYPNNSGGPAMHNDEFGKMNDISANYCGGYMRGNFAVNDHQHGAVAVPNSNAGGDYSHQNPQFTPFQQNMRPNYPHNSNMPRGPSMQGRIGMTGGMGSQNYNNMNQQRPFMSGHTIQQQSGPTPTLNQLLQNSNSSQRYQGTYSDYPVNSVKEDSDHMSSNQGYGMHSSWNQRPMNSYSQQGNMPSFRSQMPVCDPDRRPMPGYQQHSGGYPSQISPNSQRFSMGQSRMGHSSQGMPSSTVSHSDSADSQPVESKCGISSAPTDSSEGNSAIDRLSSASNCQDGVSASSDDVNSDNSTRASPPPVSQTGHTATQKNVPSPGGSNSSRSNTPASLIGCNSSSSPMPPRPPSNQLEGAQGRIQSPMASQQGGFRGGPGMGMYSHQNAYNGPTSVSSNQYNYPNMGMNRGMNNMNYPGPYAPGPAPNNTPYNNYMGQNNLPPGVPPGQAGPPSAASMPPSSHANTGAMETASGTVDVNAPKGAQAAAHAAMLAANNQATGKPPYTSGRSRSPSAGPPHPPGSPTPPSSQPTGMPLSPSQHIGPPSAGTPGSANPHHPAQMGHPIHQHGPMLPGGMNGPMMHPPRPYGPPGPYQQNHMNYNQIGPSSGMHGMTPSSMESGVGPGGGPPFGPGPTNSRYAMSSGEMTTTHGTGMSGGCVSVAPVSGNSMAPNSIPNSMPVNSMCEINNGIPPNAMAPSTGHMGPHGMGLPGMNPMGNGTNLHTGGRPVTPGSMHEGNSSDLDVKPSLSCTIAGDTSTTVTQSITTPLPNASESKAAQVMGPPPPRASILPSQLDSSSQDSHSSSQDSDSEKLKMRIDMKMENSSPGTSVNEDQENMSSPSWPGTPKPDIKANERSEKGIFNDVFQKQLEFSSEPERRTFLERLFLFMEERGNAITQNPTISKQPIDLYKLYVLVKEKGGMVDVTKNKKWRDVSGALTIGTSSSAGFTLRKNYAKYLFPLECKFDRGDADPGPILASLETPSKKESKKSQQATQQAPPPLADPFRQGQQGYNAFGSNMRHTQIPGNADMHGPMMPPNVSMMPGNSMQQYDTCNIMPGNNMMHNNNLSTSSNMMPNMNMAGQMGGPHGMMNHCGPPSNHMMPPGGVAGHIPPRSTNDSVSVQNPFADAPNPMASQYQPQHGIGQQMAPFSGPMQQPTPMHGFGNRGMPGYPGSTHASNYDNSNSNDGYNSQNSSGPLQSTTNSMPFNQTQYNSRMGPGTVGPSFSQHSQIDGQLQDRSDTPQACQPTPQPGPGKIPPPQLHSTDSNSSNSSSSVRPPSQPNVYPDPSQPAASFPGYNHSPQTQLTPPPASQEPPVSAQMPNYQNQTGNGYVGRSFPQDRNYSNYSSQPAPYSAGPAVPYSGPPNAAYSASQAAVPYSSPPQGSAPYSSTQGSGPYTAPFPSQQNAMSYPSSGAYSGHKPPPGQYPGPYSAQKNYTDMSGRDGYMSSGGHGQHGVYGHYGMYGASPRSQNDLMQPDLRRDVTWSPGQNTNQRYPSHGGPGYPGRPMGQNMQQPSSNYPGYFNRMSPHVSQMSPTRSDKYSSQSKLQKSGAMPGNHVPTKKEIIFPSDCVESTQPHLIKRRKLRHKDIGQVDAWRLMMALKSGLLAESTWALDTLSILLFDDSTVAWFGLQHMPGLIEVLLDHYRRCLIKIFDGDFEELEISSERKKELQISHPETSLVQVDDDDEEIVEVKEEIETDDESPNNHTAKSAEDGEKDSVQPKPVVKRLRRRSWRITSKLPDPESLKEPNNFTLKTINGKLVKIEEQSDSEWMLKEKHWDIYQGFESSTFDWQLGRADTTSHILTHLDSKEMGSFFHRCFFRRKNIVNACEGFKNNDTEKSVVDNSTAVIPKEEIEDEASKSSLQKPMSLPLSDQDLAIRESELNCTDCYDNGKDVKLKSEDSVSCESVKNIDCESDTVVIKLEDLGNIGEHNEHSVEDGDDLSAIESGRQLENLKRKWIEAGLEGEAYQRDELPFMLIPESMEQIAMRCICISNILRSLSFIPTNDSELSRHSGLMLVLGRLLLLHHTHPVRNPEQHKFDREVELDLDDAVDDGQKEWWWNSLDALRENTLVTLANICGQVHLVTYPEEICLPILDGLLHWAVCASAYAQDPMPTMSSHSVLSAQRLAMEALCKLCITDSNVDLVLATPPFSRIILLLGNLIKLIADRTDQVMREFSIVLLSGLVQGDSSAARAVALNHQSISLLIDFIETAEQQALQIANTHAGITKLQENPEMMGTSLDMLRRTAVILRCLAQVPENRNLFQHHQHRLLHLVMSQILDHRVAAVLSDVLYNCAQEL